MTEVIVILFFIFVVGLALLISRSIIGEEDRSKHAGRSFVSSKINFKLVRSFSIGFEIHSPKLNGFCVGFHFGCFHLCLWSRGKKWFGFNNYWNG